MARHKKPLVVEANSIVDEKFEFLKLNGAGRKEVVVSMVGCGCEGVGVGV